MIVIQLILNDINGGAVGGMDAGTSVSIYGGALSFEGGCAGTSVSVSADGRTVAPKTKCKMPLGYLALSVLSTHHLRHPRATLMLTYIRYMVFMHSGTLPSQDARGVLLNDWVVPFPHLRFIEFCIFFGVEVVLVEQLDPWLHLLVHIILEPLVATLLVPRVKRVVPGAVRVRRMDVCTSHH